MTDSTLAYNLTYDLTLDELEFLRAVDKWKREHGRPFPRLTDYLSILRSLGYAKKEEVRR